MCVDISYNMSISWVCMSVYYTIYSLKIQQKTNKVTEQQESDHFSSWKLCSISIGEVSRLQNFEFKRYQQDFPEWKVCIKLLLQSSTTLGQDPVSIYPPRS